SPYRVANEILVSRQQLFQRPSAMSAATIASTIAVGAVSPAPICPLGTLKLLVASRAHDMGLSGPFQRCIVDINWTKPNAFSSNYLIKLATPTGIEPVSPP
ncbi:MAG: hypothetical protein QF666_11910, partial [Alphaproteobacteria bacterium]|nr:hypothetical protein [Alphaproteobacteria bacterium]